MSVYFLKESQIAMTATNAKFRLITSMIIFGTVGIFVRNIPLSSSIVALARGIIGMLFLLVVICIKRAWISWDAIGKKFFWLCLSGVCLGFNWILLFEAYRYTSVSTATLCYYMAPILVIIASPVILKERLTLKKFLCVLLSMIGMFCISGVLQSGFSSPGEGKGIFLGLAAAVLYAAIILMNKQIRGLACYDKTILQLGISTLVLLPYYLATQDTRKLELSPYTVLMLLLVGILHTGICYYLYFSSIESISGQTVAIISYLDPVVAVAASVLILREPILFTEVLGGILILGAALASELCEQKYLAENFKENKRS